MSADESQRWSCGTLQDGVNHMDLVLAEQEILQKIQAIVFIESIKESVCSNSPFDRLWMMKSSRRTTNQPESERHTKSNLQARHSRYNSVDRYDL